VLVNGSAAPLTYASTYRVDFQVPFSVSGTSATIQVKSGGGTSQQYLMLLQNAQPGIFTAGAAPFTLSGSGGGAAAAMNQDGSVNSAANPAAKGSILSFFASGLGAVNPPLAEGVLPPSSPLSSVAGNVQVLIGGVITAVEFAGLAPGQPGIYQVNVQVPFGSGSGLQPLVLYVNGQASQSNVTVQIK
jgi:uncharacterized protein (TIGR03437 family)